MKGRPILGVISGFLFGVFGGLTLFMYGVVPFHSPVLWILPLAGIVLGLVLAAWAPFGKAPSPANAGDSSVTYAASGAATMSDMTVEEVPSIDEAAQAPDDTDSDQIEQ